MRALLERPEVRLVSLNGTGGIGKTRLAIQIANDAAADFPDGIAFVSLSALTDPDLVLPTLAQALGITGPGIHTIEERLVRLLDGQRMLLVLDNFEHVMAAAAALLALLHRTRVVTVLVTSRMPLRISGEHEFAVPPLELANERSDLSEIAGSSACALFEARTQAVRTDFAIDSGNAETVLEICRRLGGVPLAIELAAARGKVLTPGGVVAAARAGSRSAVGGASRPSHSTSNNARRDPVELRPADTRAATALPAALRLRGWMHARGGGISHGGSANLELLDGLTALIDAGLVRQEPQSDGLPRYRMLDLIRRFGLERLQAGMERERTVRRFADWCIGIAEQAGAAFTGDGPGVWADTLAREIDNFRTAIALLEAQGDYESVLRMATALDPLWSVLGHQREGLQVLLATLSQLDEGAQPFQLMRARLVAARLATTVDDFPLAAELATLAHAEAERAGDDAAIADAHIVLGNRARGVGDHPTAWEHYEAALDIYRALDDRYNIGYALVQLAKLGDLGTPDLPGNPADLAAAEERCQQGLAIYRQLRNLQGVARATNHLSYLYYKAGRFAEAAQEAYEALWLFNQSGNLSEGSQCLENLADVAGATGKPLLAARLYGMAEALQDRFGTPMWPFYRAEYEQEVARVRAQLSPPEMQAAWSSGRNLPDDTLIAEALAASEQLSGAPDPAPTLPATLPFGLTNREIDVLRLLATGATNPEIADALFISVTTVKSHVQSIMRKLDLSSRSALAAWATRSGIAPTE